MRYLWSLLLCLLWTFSSYEVKSKLRFWDSRDSRVSDILFVFVFWVQNWERACFSLFYLKNDNWIFARNFGVNLHFRQVRIMTFSRKNIEKCFGLTDFMKKHISKICITFCRGWREQPKPWKRMDGSRTSSNCWLKPFRLSMAGKGKGVHLVILICVHVSKLNKFKNWHCGFFHL